MRQLRQGLTNGFLLAAVVHNDTAPCDCAQNLSPELQTSLATAMQEFLALSRTEKRDFIAGLTKELGTHTEGILDMKHSRPAQPVPDLPRLQAYVLGRTAAPVRAGFSHDKGLQRTLRRLLLHSKTA